MKTALKIKGLKTTGLKLSAAFGAIAIATASACVSVNIGPKGAQRSKGVEYSEPAKPFEALKGSQADGAWQNHSNGNSISYLSTCNDPADPPLENVTRELFSGLSDLKTVHTSTAAFNGREALDSEVEGRMDGVLTRVRAIVFKKNDCLYTISYIGVPKAFEEDRKRFEGFLGSFPGAMIHDFATALGGRLLHVTRILGGVGLLIQQVARELRRRPVHFFLIIEQIYSIGVRSIGLIFVTSASTGMVMALQFGLGLEKFGGKLYIPKIVALSIIREMGPVFCGLMIAARVGAGIASEIGSMTVTQQIDAIRALGTSPVKRIVIPRIIACLISLPLLCALGDVFGVIGSMIVGVTELGLDPMFYLEKAFTTVTVMDYLTGVGKTFFFAFFISVVSCYFGLNVKGGTQGVGSATTRSVVVSSVLVLISDFFLTKLFFIVFERGSS